MVSHPESGSDTPIGSDRELGHDSGPLQVVIFFICIPLSYKFSMSVSSV